MGSPICPHHPITPLFTTLAVRQYFSDVPGMQHYGKAQESSSGLSIKALSKIGDFHF
jgi:hypothetical protein